MKQSNADSKISFEGNNFLDKDKIIQFTEESKVLLSKLKEKDYKKEPTANAVWSGFIISLDQQNLLLKTKKGVKGTTKAYFNGTDFISLPDEFLIELTEDSKDILESFIKKNPSVVDEIDSVSEALLTAGKFSLQSEVVLFALLKMKENSNLSIEHAMYLGLAEWDCL